jgi:predicted alpha/beta superfamily hydrolase
MHLLTDKLLIAALFVICLFTFPESVWSQKSELVANPTGNSKASGIEIQSFYLTSVILRETREILLVLPSSYSNSSAKRRYPITVITDGEYLLPTISIVYDELSSNGQIPESILVGIKNVTGINPEATANKRVHDLTPPGLSVSGSSLNEGGDLFLDFIEDELLPAVARQFRGKRNCVFL